MTIPELIERLEALKAEHGDLPVKAYGARAETAMEIEADDAFLAIGGRYVVVSGY